MCLLFGGSGLVFARFALFSSVFLAC
uniref:Uncharacterized protein n=1 Tax=Anguilla anguilla TaxID=7936 RepID=A0A0E9PYZ3_ANGAN